MCACVHVYVCMYVYVCKPYLSPLAPLQDVLLVDEAAVPEEQQPMAEVSMCVCITQYTAHMYCFIFIFLNYIE